MAKMLEASIEQAGYTSRKKCSPMFLRKVMIITGPEKAVSIPCTMHLPHAIVYIKNPNG